MDRKKLYNEISSLGLKEEIKNKYGKNYTQCTNDQLYSVVNLAKAALEKQEKKAGSPKGKSIDKAFLALLEVLERKKILLKSEKDYILNK